MNSLSLLLPFLSWNLDHKSFHSNILWAKPGSAPFNELGIVPVRYKGELADTIFAEQYYEEKYSAYLDNINLLYVAFTRGVNAIIGFAPDQPRPENRIAGVIKNAISFTEEIPGVSDLFFPGHYDEQTRVFEYGVIPETEVDRKISDVPVITEYQVNDNTSSLRLKLHWENYFNTGKSDVRERINYGKVMHEIFSEIITSDDINTCHKEESN